MALMAATLVKTAHTFGKSLTKKLERINEMKSEDISIY
jgi:hypothetical protein